MKKLFFVFLLLSAVFSGCKKDDSSSAVVLDRAQFIGSWTGTATMTSKINGELFEDTQPVTLKLEAGADADQILMDKSTKDELKCNVTGKSFQMKAQTKSAPMGDGTNVQMTVSGNGTLAASGVLTISVLMEGNYMGLTISENLVQTLHKN